MSVATKNPFALLEDDASAPSSNAGTAPAPAAAAPTPPATRGGANKTRGGPASRGGKYYSRGGGAKPAGGVSEETPAGGERPKRNFDGEERGRGRGRGGGRGRGEGRGRGGARGGGGGGGGRLDRHSGTGKVDTEKKVSQGWGGDDGNAELKAEEGAIVDATAEGDAWGAEATAADDAWGGAATTEGADPWAAPNASDEPAGDDGKAEARRAREKEQEEEDNTLTLDQYLAQKAEKEASIVPKLEVRKANEGGDDSLWKDAVQLQRGEEEEAYFAGKAKSAPKQRTKKEEKVYLEIDARFDRPERPGRGGRGGRGGDRGRGDRPPRGRGGARGGRQNGNNTVVNVDDEKAFPSLS